MRRTRPREGFAWRSTAGLATPTWERAEGRTVADCAADAAVVADALGGERFFTIGGSGGGPHAFACAALLPERVAGAATIAGVAPTYAESPRLVGRHGRGELEEFAAA